MRTIEDCINDLACDIENFIGGNITERQNELIQEILEIHKVEKRPKGKWIQIDSTKCKCSKCDIITLIAQYPHIKLPTF